MRTDPRRTSRHSLLLASGAAALLALAACGEPEAIVEETAVVSDTALLTADAVRIGAFTLAGVSDDPWRDGWHLPARVTLDPAAVQPLGSLVEGRVMEVRVFPGDRVREGDILVLIHSHEVMDARQRLVAARSGATAADSAAAVAEGAAARAERLLAAQAMSLGEVERARAARAAAMAARESAHAERERAVAFLDHLVGKSEVPAGTEEHAALVRAPFAGVTTGRTVQPGQVVLVGQPLLTIARGTALGLALRVPEEASASIARDVPVRFTVPAFPGRTFEARVVRVAPVVDSVSRAIEVWAAVRGDAERELRAEMSADAELFGSAGARVLSVPAAAVQLMEGDTVVVLGTRLGEGLLIEARRVRVGRRTSLRAEILGGVVVGDSVLVSGAALGKAEIVKRRSGGEGGGH
jgi:cobalt-zinc-cadmium efflux system membrane fusion protein